VTTRHGNILGLGWLNNQRPRAEYGLYSLENICPMLLHPAMRDWRAIFGRNVRKLRQQRGLTQEQLAFEADIDLTYVGGIERAKRNPSLLVMARIADALSVSLIRLLAD
jgi:DNA-binding XRE family transcriptional regulator